MPWYRNRSGEQLWYEEQGSGCPIVLLHGWCMSSAVWKYQFDGLAGSIRLIAPDLRGHGRSRRISGSLTFTGFANDLVDLFEQLDLRQTLLVGWSMGGQIALQASSELSGRLAGLALVSATPRFVASSDFSHALADKEVRGMRLKVQRNTLRALEGFYSRIFSESEFENHPFALDIKVLLSSISPPDTTVALDALDALAKADMRDLLAGINVPTLILNGAQDQICVPQASSYLKDHISDAEQLVFPLSGHAPFLTYPHKFNEELINFSRRVCDQHT